tara:strand:+ start:434 stop:1039 length:606 start_codon:yes stop_codon:yes gene_type:complete
MLIDKKLYFSHIPRTGGRHVRQLLINNCNSVEHYSYACFFKHKELPHLTHREYEEFLEYKIFKKFTIVRDPVDRFISSVQANSHFKNITNEGFYSLFKNQDSVNCFINKEISNPLNFGNWFNPQIDFIDFETKLWNYENKFENSFFEWMLKNFNFEIKNKTTEYPTSKEHDFKRKEQLYLNDTQKAFIKNYYYKDYKILGY